MRSLTWHWSKAVEIKSAVFITSLPRYTSFTGMGLPQIAVAGRSNVGKSSLINSLCKQRNLAKTSSAPGKTRLINVFLINNAFHLIDLPGYGYAQVSKKEKESWGTMMDEYFSYSEHLKHVLHLVDIRHEPSADDRQMNAYLYGHGFPFSVVATKADKLSRAQRGAMLPKLARVLAVQPWEIIPYSAQNNEGRVQLLTRMEEALNQPDDLLL
ncbi:MAG: YihA family ribosome biogenesis GTP-binding protein [Clostridiales bacterium]|nr:YihA family ribosome biogenesis GTP-binding protein [Clostridiales bacterium]